MAIQHFIGEAVPALLYVTQIGVFLVILAVMLPIEVSDVGKAAKARNSEAVIGVAVSAFPGHPLVYLAIILGPIVEL